VADADRQTAICPGSYDPVTNGHLDIIARASNVFERVVVGVVRQPVRKPKTLFSADERKQFVLQATEKLKNVEVEVFDTLLVDFAHRHGATALVKGLRAISDFEFEFQMALMNRKLRDSVETIFLMPKEEYTYLSSRLVKEIARLGGDVSKFVPGVVATALGKKFKR